MVLPIGFLIFLNLPKDSAAEFDAKKEDTVLSTPIFDEKESTTAPKYTFKDPFVNTAKEEVVVKETPLAFTVGDTVTTTGANIQIAGFPLYATIHESTNQEAALAQGVWRDPKYGTPDNNDIPIVLAAHRWGENTFSWDYRNRNLFTQFDQIKGGEIVSINWNNKVYKYQINKIETSDHVTKTDDLIMYTCIDYYSSERIIVYATRIN